MDSQVSPTIYINTFSAPEATIRKVHTSRSEENQHGEIFFQEADSSMVWVRVENFGLLLAVTALWAANRGIAVVLWNSIVLLI